MEVSDLKAHLFLALKQVGGPTSEAYTRDREAPALRDISHPCTQGSIVQKFADTFYTSIFLSRQNRATYNARGCMGHRGQQTSVTPNGQLPSETVDLLVMGVLGFFPPIEKRKPLYVRKVHGIKISRI